MKLPITVAVGLITIGFVSRMHGDPGTAGGGGYNTQPTGTSSTSSSTQTGNASSTASPAPNEPGLDDTLYRGKRGAGAGAMLRDEGILHEKPRPREKVVEVNSGK